MSTNAIAEQRSVVVKQLAVIAVNDFAFAELGSLEDSLVAPRLKWCLQQMNEDSLFRVSGFWKLNKSQLDLCQH